MASLMETECCGIRELDGVEDAESAREAVVDAAENWFERDKDGAFIFYSTTNGLRIGHEIAAYITKYRLGVVTKTRAMRNPNSDNMLTMWIWQVNKSSFAAFWHRTNRYKKEYADN